jgi:hypothetical protein
VLALSGATRLPAPGSPAPAGPEGNPDRFLGSFSSMVTKWVESGRGAGRNAHPGGAFPIATSRARQGMSRKKLLDELKQNPARFYRAPADIVRDRRFNDEERLEILLAWDGTAIAAVGAQIAEARKQIEDRLLVPAAKS